MSIKDHLQMVIQTRTPNWNLLLDQTVNLSKPTFSTFSLPALQTPFPGPTFHKLISGYPELSMWYSLHSCSLWHGAMIQCFQTLSQQNPSGLCFILSRSFHKKLASCPGKFINADTLKKMTILLCIVVSG